MFMAMKWAVAFPLLVVAEGAAIIALLELFVDHEIRPLAWVVLGVALMLSFLSLTAGYMLRERAEP